jgi:FkbM family methyltransferase
LLADLARPDDGQQGVEFRLRGGRGTISCPNVPGARVPVYEVFAEDAYRLQALTAGLPEDLVAVDIGAHIGCFSVALALARPRATVHAWEASPSTARWLRRNLVANGLEDRVVAHDRAVSDHRGTLHLADNSQGSALNGLTATAGTLVEVPCVPVADVLAAAGGEVQLVKIDTEGAEYALVLGSDPKVWSSVQRVVLEWHDVPGHSWAELAEFFARAGLRVTDVEQSAPRQGTAWLAR